MKHLMAESKGLTNQRYLIPATAALRKIKYLVTLPADTNVGSLPAPGFHPHLRQMEVGSRCGGVADLQISHKSKILSSSHWRLSHGMLGELSFVSPEVLIPKETLLRLPQVLTCTCAMVESGAYMDHLGTLMLVPSWGQKHAQGNKS